MNMTRNTLMRNGQDVDRFIAQTKELHAAYRVKEELDFQRAGLGNNPHFPQFKVLCMYDIAVLYDEMAGDGEKVREAVLEALSFIESDMSMIYAQPSLAEVMEDMYVKLCDTYSSVAISYEEYEEAMAKIPRVRPHTPLQKGQMELIANMKNEGQSWLTNIILLADRYAGNDGTGESGDQFGQAASLLQLVLKQRRSLRPQRTELKYCAHNYAVNIYNLLLRALNHHAAARTAVNPDDYLFIVDKAIEVLEECRRDVGDEEVMARDIADLNALKQKLRDIPKSGGAGAFTSGPKTVTVQGFGFDTPQGFGFDTPRGFGTTPRGFGSAPPEFGAAIPKVMRGGYIAGIVICLIIAALFWKSGLIDHPGSVWRIVLAVIFSISGIVNIVMLAVAGKKMR